MRYLIFGTFALLLLLSQTTQAQAQQWEELSSSDVGNAKPTTVRDLLEVAIGYVIQKGKFESTKAPFTGDFYSTDYDHIKYERRNTSTLTYYRYNFLLTEDDGPSAVNATVIVSYNPSHSNFIVTNYRYKIDYNGQGEDGNDTEDALPTEHVVIDTRSLTGDGDEASLLSDSFDEIIAGHIERGTLPDDTYAIYYVYCASSSESDGDEGNEGFKYYDIWIKMRSSEGKYYLMEVKIDIRKTNDGELLLESPNSVGALLMNNLNIQ